MTVIWIHIFQQFLAMVSDFAQHGAIAELVLDPTQWSAILDSSHSHAGLLAQVLAEQFDTDVFRGFREWGSNFIESGQIWALIVGIVLGYLLRGFTTYG
jgi:hypothetical protein